MISFETYILSIGNMPNFNLPVVDPELIYSSITQVNFITMISKIGNFMLYIDYSSTFYKDKLHLSNLILASAST